MIVKPYPGCFASEAMRQRNLQVCKECSFFNECGDEAEKARPEILRELRRLGAPSSSVGRPQFAFRDTPGLLHAIGIARRKLEKARGKAKRPAPMIVHTGLVEDRRKGANLVDQAAKFRRWLEGQPPRRGRPLDPELNANTWLVWRAASSYLGEEAGPSAATAAWAAVYGTTVSVKAMTARLNRVKKSYKEFEISLKKRSKACRPSNA